MELNREACKRCRKLENELLLANMVLNAVERALDGEEVSDFEESFPLVMKAKDTKWFAVKAVKEEGEK